MVIVNQGSVRDLSAPKDLDDDLDDEMGIYLVCPMREPFGQPRYGHFRDDFRGEGNQQEGRQAQRGGGHGLRSPARGMTPLRDAIFFCVFFSLVGFYARPSAVVQQQLPRKTILPLVYPEIMSACWGTRNILFAHFTLTPRRRPQAAGKSLHIYSVESANNFLRKLLRNRL